MRWLIGVAFILGGCVTDNEDAVRDGGVGQCVPGRTLDCACAGGVTGAQVCLDDRTFGACVCGAEGDGGDARGDGGVEPGDGGGVCEPGTREQVACGVAGSRTRDCETGGWSGWSACEEPQCADGERERQACGAGDSGEQWRTCEDGTWGPFDDCVGAACDEDGEEEGGACGLNGRGERTRRCEDGTWAAWSECADEDRCVDGLVAEEPCGAEGQRSRTCRRGQWGNWTACMQPCPDGTPPPCGGPGPAGCPFAEVAEPVIEALPLDTIVLDVGERSRPQGEGEPVAWRWIVVDRPEGSTARLVEPPAGDQGGGARDDLGTPTAAFFLDLAGVYVFELQVEGEGGKIAPSDACPQAPARVTVDVTPGEDIHVQLVWHTPSDEDQTDQDGTDLDLHLLYPGGTWETSPLDCYWSNSTPDWGPPGPAGNPSLDIDDTNGAGPENINLDRPAHTEGDRGYQVGVIYYRSDDFLGANDWGVSDATVRIFLEGQLRGEFERRLERSPHAWHVAQILWSDAGREVVEIDEVFPNGFPR